MVNRHIADADLIKTVLIQITGRYIMVSLICGILTGQGHKVPLQLQLSISQRVGSNRSFCIVAAVKEYSRNRFGAACFFGQIADCNIVTCRAVAAIACFAPVIVIASHIDVVDAVNDFTGLPIEYRHIFI